MRAGASAPPPGGNGALPDGIVVEGLAGVYTGWLGHENLGDEIVADIFLDLLAGALVELTGPGTCVSVERSSEALARNGWRGCSIEVTLRGGGGASGWVGG
eukprot:242227-Chlamydomonas_euryale.AAC.1